MTATSPSKETILVADDEASIRRILETRLSMIGYQVVTACDGNEALDLGKLEVLSGVKVFPARVKCATLAWHTLTSAINNSQEEINSETRD